MRYPPFKRSKKRAPKRGDIVVMLLLQQWGTNTLCGLRIIFQLFICKHTTHIRSNARAVLTSNPRDSLSDNALNVSWKNSCVIAPKWSPSSFLNRSISNWNGKCQSLQVLWIRPCSSWWSRDIPWLYHQRALYNPQWFCLILVVMEDCRASKTMVDPHWTSRYSDWTTNQRMKIHPVPVI